MSTGYEGLLTRHPDGPLFRFNYTLTPRLDNKAPAPPAGGRVMRWCRTVDPLPIFRLLQQQFKACFII